MTLGIMTISIMTLGIMTLSIMTISIMAISILTISIMTISITILSIMTIIVIGKIVILSGAVFYCFAVWFYAQYFTGCPGTFVMICWMLCWVSWNLCLIAKLAGLCHFFNFLQKIKQFSFDILTNDSCSHGICQVALLTWHLTINICYHGICQVTFDRIAFVSWHFQMTFYQMAFGFYVISSFCQTIFWHSTQWQ
jgi:hypothetical protein